MSTAAAGVAGAAKREAEAAAGGEAAPEAKKAKDVESFDAEGKERSLQAEAHSWAAPSSAALLPLASEDDIPTLDVSALSGSPTPAALKALADDLRKACREVGFHFIVGHGVSEELVARAVQATETFAELPTEVKSKYLMDAGDFPGGTGFLPVNNFKLPKREKGNVVQAFIVKRELGPRNISLDDMPWPSELGSSFRGIVEEYAAEMEALGRRMLPAYGLALGEDAEYFESAFKSPLFRFRMSKYPAMPKYEEGQYGIAPHVDTSFLTILHRTEKQPALVVWSERTKRWVRVPAKPGALLINSGEILRQVSNDTFLSARHYVVNEGTDERVSLAYFFNATADFKLPVAAGAGGGPAKYPPTSYLDGQGVVQGE